ncbi:MULTISPECIES: hypothetical protein [Nocardiopsis]|uniref:Uncharacterized protein n=1 Tax=Nocardiopsis sinuspersici TaxID=501010 RepID=A0A1V3C5E9_9ACTN|nr:MULTISPECIES: hypothetical protein [Nocardiopsis]OOC55923.1 hypothetical protein NOSIN_20525 [Nocardiopsis sinuspersici]
MRRSLATASAVCLMAVTACEGSPSGSEDPPETAEEVAERGLVGIALLHRGYEGGDPEKDQVLVFHDPETGQPLHELDLPDGAVDPMAPDLPVHAQFSEDWRFFAYATDEPSAITVAALTGPGEDGAAAEEGGDAAPAYEPVESVGAAAGEVLSHPVVHGDRLWYVSTDEQAARPPQVMSVPLDAPGGAPEQEGTLVLGEQRRPSDWALTPDGALHVRDSVPTRRVPGAGGPVLVVRETGGSVVNASMNTGEGLWLTFNDAPVWGGGTAVLGPDPDSAQPAAGAYLVTVDGQSHTSARLLEDSGGPVVQYTPSPGRDALLLQTGQAWYRVDLEEGGVAGTEELFPRFHDASMDGYPLVVRWSQEAPEADPGASPSG